jgi:hypothetical protein
MALLLEQLANAEEAKEFLRSQDWVLQQRFIIWIVEIIEVRFRL